MKKKISGLRLVALLATLFSFSSTNAFALFDSGTGWDNCFRAKCAIDRYISNHGGYTDNGSWNGLSQNELYHDLSCDAVRNLRESLGSPSAAGCGHWWWQ